MEDSVRLKGKKRKGKNKGEPEGDVRERMGYRKRSRRGWRWEEKKLGRAGGKERERKGRGIEEGIAVKKGKTRK